MNAQQLLDLISRGQNLEKEDFQSLVKVHESFPYFQAPKILLAKYEYAKTGGNSKEFLNWSAVTSPDRVWLKEFIENNVEIDFLQKNPLERYPAKEENSRNNATVQETEEDQDENLIPEPNKDSDPKERAGILKKLGEDLHQHKIPVQPEFQGTEEFNAKNPNKVRRRNDGKDLIETIKKKAKKEILDEKKKEQIDLIKAFSKREFKLATLKEMENFQKQDDLSKSSTRLNASLVSETYAQLLLNQGKKQKAKEIYKKLMVKFPDKSSYFAELLKAIE